MSTTNDMIVARLETMEKEMNKENAALKVRIAELEKQVVSFTKDFKNSNARVEVLEKQLASIKKSKDDTSDDEVEVKKSKKEPKTKKSKEETSSDDEDKPKKKRGANGYILFSNENREDVKAKLFVGEEKPKNTEVMKQLAAMWSELGPDDKAVWTAKAKALNDVA